MFIFSHAASGYLAGEILSRGEIHKNRQKLFVWVVVIFSMVPDFDGINALTVAGHHSIFHTPVFWIVITLILWIISIFLNSLKIKIISFGLFSGTMLHLLTDWITARTVGIQWFYPFSEKNYYIYQIFPENGQIPIVEMLQDPYFTFYMENSKLAVLEIGINVLAIIILIRKIYIKS
ncbi:MAG: metal-dependent hydrolase [Fidelibacterota bacterium]